MPMRWKPRHIINPALTAALIWVGCAQCTANRIANKQNAITNRVFINVDVRVEEERQDGNLVGWRFVAVAKNSGNTPTKDATISAGGTEGPVRAPTLISPTYPLGVEPAIFDPEMNYYMPDSAPLPFALGPHAETAVAHVEISTAQAGGMMQGQPNTNL